LGRAQPYVITFDQLVDVDLIDDEFDGSSSDAGGEDDYDSSGVGSKRPSEHFTFSGMLDPRTRRAVDNVGAQ
jgi:hypothetical protein